MTNWKSTYKFSRNNKRLFIRDSLTGEDIAQVFLNGEQAKAEKRADCMSASLELLEACNKAFNLIKESGFSSGLTEDEFDATLRQLHTAITKAESTA